MGNDVVAIADAVGPGARGHAQLVETWRGIAGIKLRGIGRAKARRNIFVAEDRFRLRTMASGLEIKCPNPETVGDPASTRRRSEGGGLRREWITRLVGFDDLKRPARPTMRHGLDVCLIVTV